MQKGQLDLPLSLEDFVERVGQVDGLQMAPVDEKMWLGAAQLDWSHRDPADRVIVALAKTRNLRLLTSDKAIKAFYHKTVW